MFESIDWDGALLDRQAYGIFSCGGFPDSSTFQYRVGSLDLLRALRSSRRAKRPLSLTVRLPTRHALHGGRRRESADPLGDYLDCLGREIDLIACHLRLQQVNQFHLVGGSLLGADAMRALLAHVRKRFCLLDNDSGDYSIELEQTCTDWATMGLLRELGFNHIRLCVADAGTSKLGTEALRNPRQICSLIDAARALCYRSLTIELGYGRAWQTRESFARKVAAIVELLPNRVSLFDYAGPSRRAGAPGRIPTRGMSSLDDKRMMRRHCVEQLSLANYRYIGMGLFALPEDDLAIAQENGQLRRTCEGYSQHRCFDQIGLGVSAISQVGDLYAQNSCSLPRYLRQLQVGQLATSRGLRCGQDDHLRRTLVDSLVCNLSLDIGSIERQFGVCLRDHFAASWPLLEQMNREGLLTLSRQRIDVSPLGQLMMGSVCQAFEPPRATRFDQGLQPPAR